MAQSPSHKFGQIIGEILEAAILPLLEDVCRDCGLFLDRKHSRPARGGLRKVTWKDAKGNAHDLDFVMELGGSEEVIGTPKAFIEIAWRRYTKHSRNKSQEIQGAIIPLAETFRSAHPFLGVVLGGIFTENSLNQLKSHGFQVLYFPYENIIQAFLAVGVDADFDESTSDLLLMRKVNKFKALSAKKRLLILDTLRSQNVKAIDEFVTSLKKVLARTVVAVIVIALHGTSHQLSDAASAIEFLLREDARSLVHPFVRFEVDVRFSNGDEIRATFQSSHSAIDFLRAF